jgi:hypothetical protein
MAQPVEFGCGNARLDIGFDIVEDLGRQATGDPHCGDVCGGLY